MPKEFARNQRIGELIQQELADIIRREIAAPNLGMLTISAVKVSPDLKTAKVYTTLLGGTWTPTQAMKHLNETAGLLRHHLSQRLTTRTTPRLQFVYDTSIEYGVKLSALIDSVAPPASVEKN